MRHAEIKKDASRAPLKTGKILQLRSAKKAGWVISL